jgi:site-specific recombinase XerD
VILLWPSERSDLLRLAVAAYLARYKGDSRTHTKADLGYFEAWCLERDVDMLKIQRVQLELNVRWMQETRRYRPSTVSRRVSVLGLSHLQFEAMLSAARTSSNLFDFALVTMLGLLGLRILMHPHMLRHTLVRTMLDTGVDLRDVQIAARHADPRTTMRYDRARQNLDRHPNYILAAYMASGT